MQFKLLAIAALVAGVSAAGNNTATNGTMPTTTKGPGGGYGGPGGNGTAPTGTPSGVPPSGSGAPSSGAFANAVSGGMLGAVVAAGLTLVL